MATLASPSAARTPRRRPALRLLLAALLGSLALLPVAPALAAGIVVTDSADSSGGPNCSTPSSATLVGGQIVGTRRVYLPLIAY